MSRGLAQSINQRLVNRSVALGRSHGEVLQHFGLERFLYRLSLSPYRDRFVLKGGLMLHVWQEQASRFSRDIDLLGFGAGSPEAVAEIMREVCSVEAPEDALVFDASSVTTGRSLDDGTHHGVRVTLTGYLDKARIRVQIDIGYGDPVVPGPHRVSYPVLLDLPGPVLLAYTRESAIAEKVAAMLRFGHDNSRMKDYYDIWALSRDGDFEGSTLAEAILQACRIRAMPIPGEPAGLQPGFAQLEAKAAQWRAFVRNSRAVGAPDDLDEVVSSLQQFIGPVLRALATAAPFAGTWRAPGPWRLL